MSHPHDILNLPPTCELPEVLHPDIYKELRRLAEKFMFKRRNDQTLQPTILVHEAWLKLVKQGRKWRDRNHFFATASIAMRHILIDHARRKSRLCHGGGIRQIALRDLSDFPAPDQTEVILMVDEGISELEKINPHRAQVVVDRFFGGLTNQEIAQILDISERGVERHWAMAKVWLLRWIQKASMTGKQTLA